MTVRVYRIDCLPSGKSYIGITTQTLRRRWSGHLYAAFGRQVATPLAKAIRKHGARAFVMLPVYTARDRIEACERERQFIQELGTFAPRGYNATIGGDDAPTRLGHTTPLETRQKMSVAALGKPKSAEHRASMSAVRKGIPLKPEHAAKVKLGGFRNKGKKRTYLEVLQGRLRRCMENVDASGIQPHNPGRSHKERWRVRMSQGGKRKDIGVFDTIAEAKAAYVAAAAAYRAELSRQIAELTQ